MSAIATKEMTVEEFAAWVERPENADRHFELERGEVIEIPPAIPPVIAVEVVSLEDRVNKIAAKVDEYLAFGVLQVWVVDPESKDVAVHRPGGAMRLLERDDELAGGDELPGFSCRVSDFFRVPGQKAT